MQEQRSSPLRSKQEWTQELYQHYAINDHTSVPRNVNVLFWYNLNEIRGFRLTPRGYDIVRMAGYTLYHHKVDLKTYPITNKLLVLMDKILVTPYYWNNKHDIVLMDEKLSVLLELSGGDLFSAVEMNT